MHLLEKLSKQVDLLDEQQIIEWPRIGNNDAHDASKAEALKISHFAFDIFQRYGLIDVMGLKEAIDFVP